MIVRQRFLDLIQKKFELYPICGLLGPRQVGKTSLARQYAKKYFDNDAEFFDLEDSTDLARLENPMEALNAVKKRLIVIDEIQRRPELFQVLRILADKARGVIPDEKMRGKAYLILGSVSPTLLENSSETLAGRFGKVELSPFSLEEVDDKRRLFFRGGFPESYLANSDEESFVWRKNYISTFLERDVPNLGYRIPAQRLKRFWSMLAFYHGQIFNANALAHSLMLTGQTIQRYLDILAGTYMVRVLQPWHENIEKRQVRSSKVYYRDSGILNTLEKISTHEQLYRFPRLGAIWEGYALEQVIRLFQFDEDECFFWGTHSHAELDLLIIRDDGTRLGFEFKYTDAPRTTKSMHIAMKDLTLSHLGVIYPGNIIFPLTERITAYGLQTLVTGEFQEAYNLNR